MRSIVKTLVLVLTLCLGTAGGLAQAASDPAAAQIEAFHASLLSVMKQGKILGMKGRYAALTPAVERTFDLPAMTRFVVGPSWSQYSDAQHKALTDAFERLTVANYAHNFDSYSGERFMADKVDTRGPDKIVQSRMILPKAAPVSINYRMRQSGGTWKVIDVYLGGVISQLTTRRSDLAATAASGGAPALIANLNGQADKLLK
jgi:phospholipid transport system substrate-binding protein